MYEILVLLVLLAWIVFSVWLAARITRVVRQGALKALIFLVLAPTLSALPLADEIIGKFQFDRLCNEAGEVKIHGTLPVGVELYTADGKWRLSSSPPLPLDEYNKIRKSLDSIMRYESTGPVNVPALIPIREYEERIFDRQHGRLLAFYKHYGTSGGWISKGFEKPVIVRDQCFPREFGPEMMQRILPFSEKLGEGR